MRTEPRATSARGAFRRFPIKEARALSQPHPNRRSLIALDALNAVLADVRDGLGPYLAIYLVAVRGPSHGWSEASAGAVMTIAGIAGLIAQAPAGGLVDRIHAKRALLVAAAVAVTLSAVSLPLVEGFAPVVIGQSVAAIAAAVFAPAIAAMSLGSSAPGSSPAASAGTRRSTTLATRCRRGWRACSPSASSRRCCSG